MDELVIRCRPNGLFVIEGPVRIVDHLGNASTIDRSKSRVALCRCGQSAKKPFCDGSHLHYGFSAEELATPGERARPATDFFRR